MDIGDELNWGHMYSYVLKNKTRYELAQSHLARYVPSRTGPTEAGGGATKYLWNGLGMLLLSIPEQHGIKSQARWNFFSTRLKIERPQTAKNKEWKLAKRTLGLVDLADGTGLGGDSRHEGGGGDKELHLLLGVALVW